MKQAYQWSEKLTPVEISVLVDHTVISAGESIIRMRDAMRRKDFDVVTKESGFLKRIADKFELKDIEARAEKIYNACLTGDMESMSSLIRGLVIASNRDLIGLMEEKNHNSM